MYILPGWDGNNKKLIDIAVENIKKIGAGLFFVSNPSQERFSFLYIYFVFKNNEESMARSVMDIIWASGAHDPGSNPGGPA